MNLDVKELLTSYGISTVSQIDLIDSSIQDDVRLNYIIDKRFVLRINSCNQMSEARVIELDALAQRYRSLGLLTPRLLKTEEGYFTCTVGDHLIAYVSTYLAIATCDQMDQASYEKVILPQVLRMIGTFASQYSGVALSELYSMWTLIKLSPLDKEIDEKQENFNELIASLAHSQSNKLISSLSKLNEDHRQLIAHYFADLPKTFIQGDLNPSNILFEGEEFVGLIDFNMAGTEVNINQFVSETNGFPAFNQVRYDEIDDFITRWLDQQELHLNLILDNYQLTKLEAELINSYRVLGLISQFPNVQAYILMLEKDQLLGLKFLEALYQHIHKRFNRIKTV